jgi:transcriptional regulator with XRE-family HTH domain
MNVLTPGGRLKKAVEAWPNGGVRTFMRALQAMDPRPRGSSYAMIHRYMSGEHEPGLDFIKAAAEVLNVRETWLATGDGAMTVAEQQVEESLRTGGATFETQALKDAWAAMEAEWPALEAAPESVQSTMMIAWVSGGRYGRTPEDQVEAATRAARAVRAPLHALGIDRDDLTISDEVQYILGMTSVLMAIQGTAAKIRNEQEPRQED